MSGPSQSNTSPLSGLVERLRQSRTLASLALFGVAIVVIAGFTLHGMNADHTVADKDGLDEGQFDQALVSLGAVGVRESANPVATDSPAFGALDLTEPDAAAETEPAPLFALDEPAPAIMFEQARVTTGPLFGTPRSVPAQPSPTAGLQSPGTAFPQQATGVVTADAPASANFAGSQFGASSNAAAGLQAAPPAQTIRPVSGVRSAAWLTGTIE